MASRKTTDGLEILGARARRNRRVRQMVAEERVNFRAAALIRQAREEAGFTQAQLAAKVGTTQSVISRLEDADYAGHTLGTLQRILAALGRSLVLDLEPVGSGRQEA